MDRAQARLLLRKINQLFDAVDTTSGPLSRIEQDLLMDYTRQFYGLLREESATEKKSVAVPMPDQSEPSPPVQRPDPAPVHTPAPEASPAAVPVESPPPVNTPVHRPVAPITPEVAVETVAPAAAVQPKTAAPQPEPDMRRPLEVAGISAGESTSHSPEVSRTVKVQAESAPRHVANGHADTDVLFAIQEARDLSDKLRLSRIDDLSRAMGINERFLTINELFGGDHEAFDRTLRSLNELTSFQQARAYLETEVIPRYGWLEERKHKKAMVFIQLVQRRFV